jgi:hypothetical protein
MRPEWLLAAETRRWRALCSESRHLGESNIHRLDEVAFTVVLRHHGDAVGDVAVRTSKQCLLPTPGATAPTPSARPPAGGDRTEDHHSRYLKWQNSRFAVCLLFSSLRLPTCYRAPRCRPSSPFASHCRPDSPPITSTWRGRPPRGEPIRVTAVCRCGRSCGDPRLRGGATGSP